MTGQHSKRPPQVFDTDHPGLIEPEIPSPEKGEAGREAAEPAILAEPDAGAPSTGIRWGTILGSALIGLAGLAFSLWLTRIATEALARDDFIGWIAMGLVAIAGLAAAAILLREAIGLMKLRQLGRLRRELEMSLEARNIAEEKRVLRRLLHTFAGRSDLKWGLARFREHEGDVRDAGDLARLADREIFAPLDERAKRIVLASAKRVSVVTAISPMPIVDVVFVLVENLRMLRALATLYGGRPGLMAAVRLARMVITHIIATGGIALTDDLLGQFLGQDLIRRLSRRLGEGAFNGAMTARIGTAAILVVRPVPFLDSQPVRVRDFLAELFRSVPDTLRARR
jgi:putative membrane protein